MLSGHRILDLCDERGALAGRILADLGADVIRIEPPEGDALRHRGPWLGAVPDPERSLAWHAASPGKRSMRLDLAQSQQDRALFRRLVAGADVVIESFRPGVMASMGLDYAALSAELPASHPGLVYCSITPFGQRGPYAGFAAHDLVAVAMGGNASMTGDPERAPLRCSLPTAYMHAGPEAVVGILMALYARPELGGGQVVDVSLQECQTATLISGLGQYALTRELRGRSGHRTGRTREIWRCRDGWVSYGLRGGPARAPSLAATVAYMKECGLAPDWLQDYDWASYSPLSLDAAELVRLESAFAAFFAVKTMRELYEQALERRILLAPCNDAREILEQPQLRARDFFTRVALPELGAELEYPAFFARSSRCRIGLRGRAPRLGEHEAELRRELEQAPRAPSEPARAASAAALRTHIDASGIFSGLRILELGSGAAGPVATRYFAEQGASVIRIESAMRPDFLRLLHVTRDNRDEPGILERAPMFVLLNPNKQSVSINMKSAEGIALARRLVDWADVVAENFAPGVMQKWGLDYEQLRKQKPELVMLSGCLFGQTGPQRSYPGFGGQGAAIAGFNQLTGWPDGEALGPYATITDSLSPRYVALALLAALLHRRRTGEGQYIDLSQIETGVYSLTEAVLRQSAGAGSMARMGNHCEHAAPHAIYPCRPEHGAERWIAIAVFGEHAWKSLVGAMGRPAWASEPRFASLAARLANQPELDLHLSDWTAAQEAELLMHTLQAAGVEAGVVRDFDQLLRDPQLAAREHLVWLEHEPLGKLAFERSGFRLSATPGRLSRPGPRLGEHNREVLGAILGLSEAEIERLVADRVAL